MGSLRVLRVLDQIIAERGAPQRIRSDYGPEFTSRAYLAWSLGDGRLRREHVPAGEL
jgi:putative transposase